VAEHFILLLLASQNVIRWNWQATASLTSLTPAIMKKSERISVSNQVSIFLDTLLNFWIS